MLQVEVEIKFSVDELDSQERTLPGTCMPALGGLELLDRQSDRLRSSYTGR